jgi:endonuclease/exonuclease/phosphatase family metal-dependent hydrolase/predicted small lipoprotein YifL
MRVRTPSFLLLSALAATLAACGPAAVPPAQSASAARAPASGVSDQLVTVMSRNLYLGAELLPVIAAGNEQEFLAATTTVWAHVNVNRFDVRAEGIADEIAATGAELVGLQEAYTWRFRDTGAEPCVPQPLSPSDVADASWPESTIVYDYVPLILDALDARGLHYHAVATVALFDLQAPILNLTNAPPTFACVRATDHGVILARDDVQTRDAQAHVYETLLPVTVLGQQVLVPRGWVSVEARRQEAPGGAPPREAEWFTFASTHLEAYAAQFRIAQAQELAAALSAMRRVILVGDLNSHPGEEGEAVLAAAGLTDVWPVVNDGDPGFTSPYAELLTVPEITLSERIDYVMVEGRLTPLAAGVVGTSQGDRIPVPDEEGAALWPSDHAGVWATIRLDPASVATNR